MPESIDQRVTEYRQNKWKRTRSSSNMSPPHPHHFSYSTERHCGSQVSPDNSLNCYNVSEHNQQTAMGFCLQNQHNCCLNPRKTPEKWCKTLKIFANRTEQNITT